MTCNRYRPSTCTKCKEEIYTYTETHDSCIIDKHKCPLGLDVSEHIDLTQLREKRKSWDGSQSLPSNISARSSKSETPPPRKTKAKISPRLLKEQKTDYEKQVSHEDANSEVNSSQSAEVSEKVDNNRLNGNRDVKETNVISESKAESEKPDVKNLESHVNSDENQSKELEESHAVNSQSSQEKSAKCDAKHETGDNVDNQEETAKDVKENEIPAESNEIHDNTGNEQSEDAVDGEQATDNTREDQNEKENVSAQLEPLQFDTSILRNKDHTASPEKRKAANLSTIIESQLSSNSATQVNIPCSFSSLVAAH